MMSTMMPMGLAVLSMAGSARAAWFDDDDDHHSNTARIVGGVIAVVFAVMACVFFALALKRRQRRRYLVTMPNQNLNHPNAAPGGYNPSYLDQAKPYYGPGAANNNAFGNAGAWGSAPQQYYPPPQAPPPYMGSDAKTDGQTQYAPPSGPPPTHDASPAYAEPQYSPPSGPPPAHVAEHNGGWRT